MKVFIALAVSVVALAATAPSFAIDAQAVIVMRYKAPDGSEKTLPMLQSGEHLTIRECRQQSPYAVPVLKRQLADAQNFPEFVGWEFISGHCEMYSDDLITTVK
ncbi:MAG: hypothetical protein JWP26_1721 [Devosia sp.]|uniref:hypothetical protein n=1 Tax=Devosia sp. TaxID=1871048 RepID=UPI002631DB24|nr:hypothetical protein [Devosia sp.]MDB5586751.1 hypothetical protein [Devosia sp.]